MTLSQMALSQVTIYRDEGELGGGTHPWSATKVGNPIPATTIAVDRYKIF